MPAPALRVHELTFRDGIATFVRINCRKLRVRPVFVEDLIQESLTEIVSSIASFRQEKGSFDKWGRGVALNVIRRHIRDAKRYAERFSEYHPNVDEHPAPAPSPERCVLQTQARCRLSSAAQDLTDQQAEILLLHVVDDLSHKEIGSELAITEEASQKCYQRARNRMVQCIADELLSVMPPFDTSCNDGSVPNDIASQWFNWDKLSHYTGQITLAILAFVLFWPTTEPMQPHAYVAGTITTTSICPMCFEDKPSVTPDKLDERPHVVTGKLEPASLPSVQVDPVRKKVVGKPTPPRPTFPRSSYKHSVSSSVNRPPG